MQDADTSVDASPEAEKPQVTCAVTGVVATASRTKTGAIRLPRGWKYVAGAIWSGDAVVRQYRTSAIIVPVARVAAVQDDARAPTAPATTKEFWAAYRIVAEETVLLANWVVSQLAIAEPPRMYGDKKMGKFKPPYLYPEARLLFREMHASGTVAVINNVQACYMADRLKVWRREAQRRVYRTMPVPMPSQSCTITRQDDGAIVMRMRFGQQTWSLILAGGHQYRRQRRGAEAIIDGAATLSECALYEVDAAGSHRAVGETRENGGGQRRPKQLMLKIVGRFPRGVAGDLDPTQTLHVSTQPDCLLAALDEQRNRLWFYNADHLKRNLAAHAVYLKRLSDDAKAEIRRPRREGMAWRDRNRIAALKSRRQVKSVLQQVAASLAKFAKRRKCGIVSYDDRERGWISRFAWSQLRLYCQQACDKVGVTFVHAGGAEEDEARSDLSVPV